MPLEKMKKWFASNRPRKAESVESLNKISTPGMPYPHHLHTKTQYELTSIKIKQYLERKAYQRVVETLRELPHNYVLKCLESFPFKALNEAVPEAFPIWETLLTKLHNSEDGYIPEFPYHACDELVLRIAWLLETWDDRPQDGQELKSSCRRVLKCVYMQYNGVLEHLYKEHDKVEHALYTLGLHLPLGTDLSTALTLQQAIQHEVAGCLIDFNDANESLREISEKEVLTLSEILLEDMKGDARESSGEEGDDFGLTMRKIEFPLAPNPNQVQLQERLYQNQCIQTCLQPSHRSGTLRELVEILNERVRGDKEVLAVFGRIRQRNGVIGDSEPIEPWLRRHQHSIECTIGLIKEIEKELEITIHKSDSPVQLQNRQKELYVSSSLDDDPQIVPIRPRSRSHEYEKSSSIPRRHSAAILEHYGYGDEQHSTDRNHLVISQTNHRPRSASPHKILRVNGVPPSRSVSSKSVSSSTDSSLDIAMSVQTSSSIHDLNSTKDKSPLPAFTRVQSLMTNNSVQVVAGKRQKNGRSPGSWSNLSISSGNVSGKKAKKSLYRSRSGNIVSSEIQLNGEVLAGNYFLLQQDLEMRTKELLQAREQIYELRRRERELTDRLSDQAQRHLQDSERFEDILLGPNRPTLVVQRYQELYSQGRVDALEAIEGIQSAVIDGQDVEVSGEDTMTQSKMFAIQLVLDVLKFAYTTSCESLDHLRMDWRKTLDVGDKEEDSVAVRQLESAVGLYLRRVCSAKDVSGITKTVEELMAAKYSSSPIFDQAKDLEALHTYTKECSKVAWDLCVQTPPMVINYHEEQFNFDLHTRFYTSNKDLCDIFIYHWPTLLQSSPGQVLSKGVVQT